MRKLVVGLGIFLLILVAIAVIAPFLIPADTYKPRIVAAVKQATGRDLTINGPIKFHVLPSLTLQASNVAFANVAGGKAKDMASIDKLDIGLKLIPLLSGDVEISRFVLTKPVIHLEKDKSGHGNWEFNAVTKAPVKTDVKTEANASSEKPTERLKNLSLGIVKIEDGIITYADDQKGKTEELNKVNAKISLPSLDKPLDCDFSASWHDQPLNLTLWVEKPRALLAGNTSALKTKITADKLKAAIEGDVSVLGKVSVEGTLDLSISSVRDFLAWTGTPVKTAGTELGTFAAKGKLVFAASRFSLADLSLSLDNIKGQGAVAIDTNGAKPSVKGQLNLDALDLNPYLSEPQQSAAGPQEPSQAGAASGNWSDAPIDLSALKTVNADFALSVGSLKFRKIEIGKSALGISLHDGRLEADLKQMALYEGKGSGRFVVDGGSAAATIEGDFNLAGLQVEKFLSAAIDLDRVSGTGALNFALAGHGNSQRQLIDTLSGKGAIHFTNGAIKGIDLAAIMKNVSSVVTGASAGGKTDFSQLYGTFTVASGILQNSDLVLQSQYLHLTGTGSVDLPHKTLDYHLTPTLNDGKPGQSLSVPVIVQGPWDHLSYRPDLESVLQQKLASGKLLKGDKGKILSTLLGGKPADNTATPSGQSNKPINVLKGLLGK